MRVLVTGACGGLGRALIDLLSKDLTIDVVATSRLGNPSRQVVPCDLRDSDAVRHLLRVSQPAVVINLAAAFDGNADDLDTLNVRLPELLLSEAQSHFPGMRIVLVGSAAEYGAVNPEDNPIRESMPLRPVSAYGISKAAQHRLLITHAAQGADAVYARIFNLYGIGLSERLFVGRVARQIDDIRAGRRKSIEVGPLNAVRDYVDLPEAARQIWLIARHGLRGETYHVASGQPVSMADILNRMQRESACSVPVVSAPELSNRAGPDVPAIYADMTKLRALERSTKTAATQP